MGKDKKILTIIFICALFLLLSGCSNEKKHLSFPQDKDGVPKSNVILVNGVEVECPDIKDSLMGDKISHVVNAKVQENGTVVVTLPKGAAINSWYIEEAEGIALISYFQEALVDESVEILEGPSYTGQTFTFAGAPSGVVRFKWANANQAGKSFEDKEEDYRLLVKVSD